MPAQRLPQALLVSNQANRERLGIAQESFRLALRFPQPHAGTATVLRDELDASFLKGRHDFLASFSTATQGSVRCLKPLDRRL